MRSTGPRHAYAGTVADDAAAHDAARVDGVMPEDHNPNGDPAAVNTTADAKTNAELIADVATKLDITLVEVSSKLKNRMLMPIQRRRCDHRCHGSDWGWEEHLHQIPFRQ